MTFILIDTQNLFIRSGFVGRNYDIDTKVGLALQILFNSVSAMWRKFEGKHAVFCFDKKSWRYKAYPEYKAHRKAKKAQMSKKEAEEDKIFFQALYDFRDFLQKKTNATVLCEDGCEADDFIARWIQLHQNDKHIIISSDSDFHQLLTENVSQYNGIQNHLYTINGVFDDKGNVVKDKKGIPRVIHPEYMLFEKCIRGDPSDNIFSANPGVRTKGTRHSPGIEEAYADRNNTGYAWNNFMLQRWVDHKGDEHCVLDDYRRNRQLIDLTAQPQDVIDLLNDAIVNEIQNEKKKNIGIGFLRFCGQYNLQQISKEMKHLDYLKAPYE